MNLYATCRAARRERRFTAGMMAALMDACGRPTLAAQWRRVPDPDEILKEQPKYTAIEYFIREAKSRNAVRLREASRALAFTPGSIEDTVCRHLLGPHQVPRS